MFLIRILKRKYLHILIVNIRLWYDVDDEEMQDPLKFKKLD